MNRLSVSPARLRKCGDAEMTSIRIETRHEQEPDQRSGGAADDDRERVPSEQATSHDR
jgi:hypothetical protein